MKMWTLKYFVVTTLTFLEIGVTWHHRSREHWSTDYKYPILERNRKWIRRPVAELTFFRYSGGTPTINRKIRKHAICTEWICNCNAVYCYLLSNARPDCASALSQYRYFFYLDPGQDWMILYRYQSSASPSNIVLPPGERNGQKLI